MVLNQMMGSFLKLLLPMTTVSRFYLSLTKTTI